MSEESEEELTPAAIARLANVGRAAVSNWRQRYPNFPQPVGGSETRPRFARNEVEAWLVSTGKAVQLATSGRTETGTHVVRNVDGGGSSVVDLTADQLLARVMVSLLPRSTAEALQVEGDADGLDGGELPVIVDPACADGVLLAAVADRFGDRVRLAGQEGREEAAVLASSRLRGHPYNPEYEIHIGEALSDDRLREYRGIAAAVVSRAPSHRTDPTSAEGVPWRFGPPGPRDAELAWVQHCFELLRPNGVGVVAVSSRTGVQSSGRHIRAELVRSGALRAVITLPRGTAPRSGVSLWVLQRPAEPGPKTVSMVDLSGLADAADVPWEYEVWQRVLVDSSSTACAVVQRTDLVDGDADLLPSRHLSTPAELTADDLIGVTDRLQTLYALLGSEMPRFGASEPAGARETVTLAELERSGALTILSRDATPRRGDLIIRTMGRPAVVASGTEADDVGIAQVVEVDANRLDEHFVATFVWADAASLPAVNLVGALSRDDLRRCRIPRLPIGEQRRYGMTFRRLRELERAIAELARLSSSVIDEIIRGLTVGVLSPEPLTIKNSDSCIKDEKREL
ncbi:N-6 DNA methylase [Kribbella sp. NPDC054772]